MLTRDTLVALSKSHGFDSVGVTSPSLPLADERLKEWLAQGFHGEMGWFEGRAAERASPTLLWGDVKSVIMLGVNYAPEKSPLEGLAYREKGLISVYAQGKDYHDVIKPRLKALARALLALQAGDVKVFVDTAPVMEKPLAMQAGLGWQGKHSNLISRDFGSWLFLGAIYTTFDLDFDEPTKESCGSCTSCLDICPTNAFPKPFVVDANRCISYLTIEHHGFISRELRPLMGNRIYGCDDCLAICPWNKFAVKPLNGFLERQDLNMPLLETFLTFDDEAFRLHFRQTPVKRIGRNRFMRNVLNAVANSGMKSFTPLVLPLLHDESPLVRGMAVYALSRLDIELLKDNKHLIAGETEIEVLDEINAVL